MRVRRFDLAQRARNQQKTMRVLCHPPQPVDKDAAVRSTGMNQVRKFFPFHHTDVLHACHGVITQLELSFAKIEICPDFNSLPQEGFSAGTAIKAVMLRLFLGLFRRSFCSRRDLLLENLALRQQLLAMKRRNKRPRLSRSDRLFWVVAKRLWSTVEGCARDRHA